MKSVVTKATKEKWKRRGTIFAATGAYLGYAPFASGTFGSALGLFLFWVFRDTSLVFQVILVTFLCGLGVLVSEGANRIFGEADSSKIVIDEIVGMMITMLGVPVTGYWMFWGFLLFRILDIVKLPPANIFDSRVKNGWGVVFDDVFAGIYGNIILHLMLRTQI